MRYTILLFFSVFALSSCRKEHHYDVKKIVFQYEYINQAWGYQHQTWFIDTNGVVRLHRSADEHESWKSADANGYLSESDLQYNYDRADTVIYQLDTAEVKEKAKLIIGITENDLSDTAPPMADAGESVLYAYLWDAVLQKYKRVFLAESGDISRVNNHPDAQILTAWLIDKGKNQVKFFNWP